MTERAELSYNVLASRTGKTIMASELGVGASVTTLAPRELMIALQQRGELGQRGLVRFQLWMMLKRRYTPKTAKRKRSLVWGCLCDYPDEPWAKVFRGHTGDRSPGARRPNYIDDIRRALRDYAEFLLDDPQSDAEDGAQGKEILDHLGYDVMGIMTRIPFRLLDEDRPRLEEMLFGSHGPSQERSPEALPASGEPPLPQLPAPGRESLALPPASPLASRARRGRVVTAESITGKPWLDYAEAAFYTGYSIGYLRNLVSADAIPHYGALRAPKFRKDMLDLFLTNRDVAMRKLRAERDAQNGD